MAAVTFAALLLELALTRLFSVVLFYHFAFLAISTALLGLGAGGVFAYVRRKWLERWGTRTLAWALCAINAVSILGVLELVLHLPISLEINRGNMLRLAVVYLATAVPFFFTGVLLSVVFARESRIVPRLYGADLIGGALACLAVVPLLNLVGGPNAVLLSAAAMGASAMLWAATRLQSRVAAAVAVGFVLLVGANYSGRLIDVVYAKGALRDPQWVEFAKWNAISRIEVNNQGGAKYIVIDADATSAIMNVDPRHWAQDAQQPTPTNTGLPAESGFNWKRALMSAAPAVANVLRPQGDVAIIGPGGGVDVLRAVANGARSVTAIEINPIIADDIMRGRYKDYSFGLYTRPEVRLHVGDGRSFIRNSRDKYDFIQMTLVDTWASTAAGAFALSENTLYTVEAFTEYFDHLKADGFIAITRWEFREPREALRVVSQGIEALHRRGVKDASRHFIVVSDGALDVDGRPVLVLAKLSPFTPEEEDLIRAHLAENQNLEVLALPSQIRATQAVSAVDKSIFREYIGFAGTRDLADHEFFDIYPYNVRPVTDEAPFFFFTLKTGDVVEKILAGSGRGMDWRINLGITVLFMLLGIALVAVALFMVLPLALHSEARRQSTLALLYFVAVGLGYILVEIALIQRFVLFLGHPTYALTVVVFLMLLSSGAGSLASRCWMPQASAGRLASTLLAICLLVALCLYVLPMLLAQAIGAAFSVKLLLCAAILVPLGFAMGMPFPTGLRAVSGEREGAVEWAYAMNAAATVLGSVLAMVVAIHFGLAITLASGAAAYFVALLLSPRLMRVARAGA